MVLLKAAGFLENKYLVEMLGHVLDFAMREIRLVSQGN